MLKRTETLVDKQ